MREQDEARFMERALRLAQKGYGHTSPNPIVGAVLVQKGKIIAEGWHQRAGQPHAEIEAIRNAGAKSKGATLYVTLEPCCTHGRTPPCTEAILTAGIRRVVVGATDPNPAHRGKGIEILKKAGVEVKNGVLAKEAAELNRAFNHWIVHRTPFVTVKAAMTLDGKIASKTGESKWITGAKARARSMELRQGADAILVGVKTVMRDDPSLTIRAVSGQRFAPKENLRRIILDSEARTPLTSKVLQDDKAALTTIVVTRKAAAENLKAIRSKCNVWVAPEAEDGIDCCWLLKKLGQENVTSLLVEGGGDVNASFLLQGLAHHVAFFYAPKVLGGHEAIKAVSGEGFNRWEDVLRLDEIEWKRLGEDILLTAAISRSSDS